MPTNNGFSHGFSSWCGAGFRPPTVGQEVLGTAIWVGLKINQEGLPRFWPMFPLTRATHFGTGFLSHSCPAELAGCCLHRQSGASEVLCTLAPPTSRPYLRHTSLAPFRLPPPRVGLFLTVVELDL